MGFNPFSSVNDYPSMLNRIAWATFIWSLLATILLRHQIPQLDEALATKVDIPVAGVDVPLGTLVPLSLLCSLESSNFTIESQMYSALENGSMSSISFSRSQEGAKRLSQTTT